MPRIMIVDDVTTIRQIVSSVLQDVKYRVIEAASADEALALAQVQRAHLVVTDVNMPGKSGLELIKELRAIKNYRNTPILILAKDATDENIQKALALGASGWIAKPFTPDSLLGTINQVLVDQYVH
jgi:two-component system, chemotaxis family, chemotaxis protein CheY